MNQPDLPFDAVIIGAGAVGSAIARELSRYELSIILLEAASDVGMGTSKASTAIWYTGFDAKPGSLESALLRRSYPLLETFMQEAGSPFERIGGLLIAWSQEQLDTLPALLQRLMRTASAMFIFSAGKRYTGASPIRDRVRGGNVLRGVETADRAALEGRSAAGGITRFLEKAEWPANRVELRVDPPLAWICPNIITSGSGIEYFRFRSNEFREHAHMQVKQGGMSCIKSNSAA